MLVVKKRLVDESPVKFDKNYRSDRKNYPTGPGNPSFVEPIDVAKKVIEGTL